MAAPSELARISTEQYTDILADVVFAEWKTGPWKSRDFSDVQKGSPDVVVADRFFTISDIHGEPMQWQILYVNPALYRINDVGITVVIKTADSDKHVFMIGRDGKGSEIVMQKYNENPQDDVVPYEFRILARGASVTGELIGIKWREFMKIVIKKMKLIPSDITVPDEVLRARVHNLPDHELTDWDRHCAAMDIDKQDLVKLQSAKFVL